MRISSLVAAVIAGLLVAAAPAPAAEALPAIESLEIGTNREFRINGEPFFPLMLFRQSPDEIDVAQAMGVNTLAESGWKWPSGGTRRNRQFLDRLAERGMYGVFGADIETVGHPYLLGMIQLDQPDEVLRVPDPQITHSELAITGTYPPPAIVDGNTGRGWLLDPLQDAEITLTRKTPLKVSRLSIWPATYSHESVIKEAAFLADGKEIARATFENAPREQTVELAEPTLLKALTVRVLSIYQGVNPDKEPVHYGRIQEIKAFDENGDFVPLYDIRKEYPRVPAHRVLLAYRWMKRVEKMRPVFMTMSPYLLEAADGYEPAERDRFYPLFAWMCDVGGVAVYPIPGENTTGGPGMVGDALDQLRAFMGLTRPVYARITADMGDEPPLTPQQVRASAWMAVIRGASGICYVTPGLSPVGKGAKPNAEMTAGLKRLNEQITRLTPAITAGPARYELRIAVAMEDDVPSHFKATELGDAVFIFAQNRDEARSGKATVDVVGIEAGTKVEVIDEDRTITAEEGRFTDDFGPLAAHVYRIEM